MILLASDFDGTLFFHEPIDRKTRDRIAAFRKEGNYFGLNTGRGLFSIEEIEDIGEPLPFDFYITDNGGILAGPGKEIYARDSLDADTIDRIVAANDPVRLIFSVGGHYMIHPQLSGRWAREFEKFTEVPHDDVTSVSVECSSHEEAQEIASRLEKMNLPVSIHVNRYSVDLCPPGLHKAVRFQALRDHFGSDARIAAVGDSYNDLPALEAADYAFTFPWAPEELKEKAVVVDSIADALEILTGAEQ